MLKRLCIGVFVSVMLTTPVMAQQQPRTLSTLFEDIFGPSGLIVSSDEVLVDGTNHAAHFNSAFQSDFRLMNIALTSQLAAVPLPSPASGFTYRFDPETGTFVRSTTSFGPILTERGETIGKGRLAFGFSHQYFSFDRLDGVRLTNVPAVFTHDDFQAGGGRSDVVFTQNTIKANVTQFSGALTYGLTERVDIALAVPIISTQLSLISNARIYRVGTGQNTGVHYFRGEAGIDGRGDTNQFFAEGSAAGIGDIVIRAKGTVMKEGTRALAVGLDMRLPTGDEQNLLGAGAMGLRGFAAFSTSIGQFAPHVNVGYQWNGSSVLAGDAPDDHDQGAADPSRMHTHKGDLPDAFHFAAGTDYAINNRLSIVTDLLSRRVIGSPRLSTYEFMASGPAGSAVLPDVRFDTASYWVHSGAVGFKANVAARVLVNFNLRFQIKEGGLSDRISPLLGVEWGF
jgi:hypothetical protein